MDGPSPRARRSIEVRARTHLPERLPAFLVRVDSLVPFARHAIALGLGAFLLYCGAAMQGGALDDGQGLLYLILGLAIAVLGVWSIVALGTSRLAAVVALVVAGVAPIFAFLGWMATGPESGMLDSILWANLLGGLLAAATAGWIAARGPEGVGGAKRTRVARV